MERVQRFPVRAADEERLAVYAELPRAVGRGGRGGDLPDAEARGERVAHPAVELDLQREVVELLRPFVDGPPQARVADHQLRELLGGEDHLLHLAAVEIDLLLEANPFADDLSDDLRPARAALGNVVGVGHLDRDGLSSHVVVRFFERGPYEGVLQADGARCEDLQVAPDARIPVADAVEVVEIPPDGHQLRHVATDFSIAAVLELAVGAERLAALGFDRSRHVHRVDLHGQDVLLVEGDLVRDVGHALEEHAGGRPYEVAVEPDLRAVVHAVGLEPDLLSGAGFTVEAELGSGTSRCRNRARRGRCRE